MIDVRKDIEKTIQEHDVVLFMKGTADAPMCGFSAVVVQVLQKLDAPFKAVNVLEDPAVRQGIKDFSDWPTVPQLYVKAEFIGGCDIVKEMYQTGELETFLREKQIIA